MRSIFKPGRAYTSWVITIILSLMLIFSLATMLAAQIGTWRPNVITIGGRVVLTSLPAVAVTGAPTTAQGFQNAANGIGWIRAVGLNGGTTISVWDGTTLVRTLTGDAVATSAEVTREVASTLVYHRERLGGIAPSACLVRAAGRPI